MGVWSSGKAKTFGMPKESACFGLECWSLGTIVVLPRSHQGRMCPRDREIMGPQIIAGRDRRHDLLDFTSGYDDPLQIAFRISDPWSLALISARTCPALYFQFDFIVLNPVWNCLARYAYGITQNLAAFWREETVSAPTACA